MNGWMVRWSILDGWMDDLWMMDDNECMMDDLQMDNGWVMDGC